MVFAAIHLNALAIAAAVLSSIAIGFVWYGPLFGNAWMAEMGVPPDFGPEPSVLKRSMLLMLAGATLTTLALALILELGRASGWTAGTSLAPAFYAGLVALFVWIGFCVPMLLGSVAWEGRSWRWFGINAGYHAAALLASAMMLTYWR